MRLRCKLVLTRLKYARTIHIKKTDKQDTNLIAVIFKYDLVYRSFLSTADIRQIRDFVRYRQKFTHFTSDENNRVQNCLIVSNIKLDNVCSYVSDKATKAITKHLIEKASQKTTGVSYF